jgi:hypothetical protein
MPRAAVPAAFHTPRSHALCPCLLLPAHRQGRTPHVPDLCVVRDYLLPRYCAVVLSHFLDSSAIFEISSRTQSFFGFISHFWEFHPTIFALVSQPFLL